MSKELFGKTKDGKDAYLYTITGSKGIEAKILDYGANLQSLFVPVNGKKVDVVLGYDNIEQYFDNGPNLGASVLPCANRIGDAKFSLNGVDYSLEVNDNHNNLHSALNGFHRRLWTVAEVTDNSITFKAHMNDGEIGFPGNLDMTLTYTLTDDNALKIEYSATTDKDTIFNPTNHSYFNLAGHDAGSVLDQVIWMDADNFTVTDKYSIPTGVIAPVKGTPLDFTTPKAIADAEDESFEQIGWAGGVDHNYCLNAHDITKPIAYLLNKESGLKMEVYTDLPGCQIYTANYLSNEPGKGGVTYNKREGVCLETQYFPNAINIPAFEQPIAKAKEVTKTTTIYKFI